MKMIQNLDLEELELTIDNKVIINNGEYEITLHPNMPKHIIEQYLKMTFDKNINNDKLILSITDRCDIGCDFCCHPHMNSEFSEEDAIKIVKEACIFGKFSEICMTGGEPFLRYDLLLKLSKICKDHNILFGIITNGSWGKDEPEKKCKELVENGVGRVSFSWDPSHGKFVSVDTVMKCIDSAMNAGLKVNLTGSFKKENDTHENYGFDLKKYKKYANFIQSTYNVAQAGRGENLKQLYQTEVEDYESNKFLCPAIKKGNDLTLYSMNGLSMPCCSIYSGYKLSMLSIGNWKKDSIEDLYNNHKSDSFYNIINNFGFKYLYKLINKYDINIFNQLPNIKKL